MPLLCSARATTASELIPVRGMEHWQIKKFSTGAALRAAWPDTFRSDNFWVSDDVLGFLTDNPQGLDTEAILVEDSRNFRRILLTTQTFSFSAAGQISDGVKGQTSGWDLRRRLLAPFSFRVLSIGQFLTSGNFCTDGLSQFSAAEVSELLPAIAETLMRLKPGYAASVIKDLYPANHPVVTELRQNGYSLMPSDPVMGMEIPANWQNFDDYLAALTSKYRVRYRRARSKMAGITSRPLSAGEVSRNRDRFHKLYCAVSGDADFNAASLRPDYFPWLASVSNRSLNCGAVSSQVTYATGVQEGETNDCFTGYFNEKNELVGFTSAVPNGDVLHAHFLGIEEAYKYSHHLYHNMLYDLLGQAIAGGFRSLDYGRTAMEIKSSVGAKATHFAVLARARYNWLNRLIPMFTPAVYAAPKWKERNPFRGA